MPDKVQAKVMDEDSDESLKDYVIEELMDCLDRHDKDGFKEALTAIVTHTVKECMGD